jgi:hypothetical protein
VTESHTPVAPAIFAAMHEVMAAVRGFAKSGHISGGGANYSFQRFEDMAEKIGDAFRVHKIFVQAHVTDHSLITWEKHGTFNNKPTITTWARATVSKKFVFTSLLDGSTLSVEARGEGTDNSDKATNKAETAALKNALKHGLMLSTRDDADPDADRPDDTTRPQEVVRNARPEQPPAQGDNPISPEQRAAAALSWVRANVKTQGQLLQARTRASEGKLLQVVPLGADVPLDSLLQAIHGTLPAGE